MRLHQESLSLWRSMSSVLRLRSHSQLWRDFPSIMVQTLPPHCRYGPGFMDENDLPVSLSRTNVKHYFSLPRRRLSLVLES